MADPLISASPLPRVPTSFFITTAIDYTNGAPHIGHAYEKVLADVLARYHRLKGDDVFFLTGVDQHGQKVQQSAEKEGVAPQEFVDRVTAKFVALWDKLDVNYGRHAEEGDRPAGGWAATTAPKHKECVRAILQRLWNDRDPATGASRWIYKKSQRGFYSVRQEQFLTDKERGPDGQFGPEWGQVEEREEENYYFRLLDHKQWLLDLIDSRSGRKKGQDSPDARDFAAGNPVNPENPANPVSTPPRPFVVPDFRVAELRNAVEKLDGDLCISRPKARLSWGIPFPFDEDYVTYVWFDALVNYISFAPHYDPAPARPPAEFLRWWKYAPGESSGVTHVIGKDILIPAHGVYWPIMLKALGFADDEMPTLLVHGWWNISGAKMSKSLGNIVDPDALADKYGAETLRYYLMSDIATGRDADFSEERLIQRYNTDLANSLGNLLNRTLNMVGKYREGVIKRGDVDAEFGNPENASQVVQFDEAQPEPRQNGASYASLKAFRLYVVKEKRQGYQEALEQCGINAGLAQIARIAGTANLLVEITSPWKLAKDPAQADRLDAVLYTLAESLRIIAILISPVLPKAAHGIFDQLAWKLADSGRGQRFSLEDAKWGGLPDGHVLGKPTPLFPRIEAPKEP